MDVLNKLRNTVSNTISNTVNSTAYGLSQLSSVLPGNPVTREFEATAHIGSAGPGLLWKIYSGYKKSTRQEAAIFVFEKRLLDKFSTKHERETLLEILKRGVTQLTKLRHPQVLTVQHPLEESRDSLAFATEPVFASLANVLGNMENITQPVPKNLKDFKLHEVEIQYGLFQLGEGLVFLHNDVKLLHRNLSPESIVINKNGEWKIFGFDSCALNQSPNDKQASWSYTEYDPTIPMIGQSNLDYQAPECIVAGSCSPASDIFSLGMLSYVLHSPDHKTIHETHGDVSRCRRLLTDWKVSFSVTKLSVIPDGFKDTVKLMLSANPELRPDAHQFIKIDYFMDIGMKTLNYLDKLFQWDNLQKSQFYKGLPQVMKQLPHRVILHRILPCLYKEFVNPPMIPFVLPSILLFLEVASAEEFNEDILPNLKPVLAMEEPPQIGLVFMQRIDLLLKLCSPEVIKTDIVPMLTRALDSRMEQLQELCLAALPSIASVVKGPAMKNTILPRIKKICTQPGANSSLSVRVNCLLCVAKMLEHLDRWVVLDQVLPFLQEIPHAGDPAILMAIIGIYKMVLTHNKLGISKELLATKILPFLLPLSIEQRLSLPQFEALVSLINDMVTRVTNEHRDALRQLDGVRREAQQLDEALLQTTTSSSVNMLSDPYHHSEASSPVQSPLKDEKGLTLEDKYRLARQQETHQRLQSQAPLTPNTQIKQTKTTQQPKDLTSTLLQNNLSQLNLSAKNINSNKSTQGNYSSLTSSSSWNSSQQWKSDDVNSQLMKSPSNNWISGDSQNGSMQWTSPVTSPVNQNSNWSNTKSQGFSNMTNQFGAFGATGGGSLIGNSQPIKQQQQQKQTTPTSLSTQDIIDFLS